MAKLFLSPDPSPRPSPARGEGAAPRDPRQLSWRWYLFFCLMTFGLPALGWLAGWLYSSEKAAAEAACARPERELLGHARLVDALAWTPDGRGFLSAGGGAVRLWDLRSGKTVRRLEAGSVRVYSVAISRDGQRALTGDGTGTIRLWDLTRGVELKQLAGHQGNVRGLAFLGDGRRAVSAGQDGGRYIWDLDLGGRCGIWVKISTPFTSLAPLPDGRRVLLASSQGITTLLDFGEGGLGTPLPGGDQMMFAGRAEAPPIACSPDGKRFLYGNSSGGVLLGDLERRTEIRRLDGGGQAIYAVAFLPDGRRAASGGEDGKVRLWDLESGRLIRVLEPPAHGGDEYDAAEIDGVQHCVLALAVSPDGRWLLWGGCRWYRKHPYWEGLEGREAELYLWRLPNRLGWWFLGTQEPSAKP